MFIFSKLDFVRFAHMLVDCDSRGCIWFWGKNNIFFLTQQQVWTDWMSSHVVNTTFSNTALCLTAEIRPVCHGEAK